MLPVHSKREVLFCPVYPGVGGVSGNVWRNLSSSALNLVKELIDLMLGGTALNSAEAVDENELNLNVFQKTKT